MGKSCRLSPVVFKREGTRIVERDSKLFQDIKDAVQDYDTAWQMWAFSKTDEFKKRYKNLEYDELGEVTFPSLIKALGLEKAYNMDKNRLAAEKEYGFKDTVFPNPVTATVKVNDFNQKEKNLVAIIIKDKEGYKVQVVPRNPTNLNYARQQSFNHALSNEIVDMLHQMGFDVSFVSDTKFRGLFDPDKPELVNGFLQVIKIAKGEKGEDALPEEFSHLIIEGLINHPLIQRLLSTLDATQVQEILGNMYERYSQEYQGDGLRLKKEAAGKLLAQFITGQGNISQPVIQPRRSLLSRIWNWVKNIFSKTTNQDIDEARLRAHDTIAGIYNLVASGEAVNLIDKHSVINAEKMFFLDQNYNDMEKAAMKALEVEGRLVDLERKESDGKLSPVTIKTFNDMNEYVGSDRYASALMLYLRDVKDRAKGLQEHMRKMQEYDENQLKTMPMEELRTLGKLNRTIRDFNAGVKESVQILATFSEDAHMTKLGIPENTANEISKLANEVLARLNGMDNFVRTTELHIVYNISRKQYKNDIVRGIGSRRNEIMALDTILDHAEKDINWADRWLTAMSDASDEMLTIIDSIVKNQQFDRDEEIRKIEAEIAMLDKNLRKAGFTSEFIYEMKEGVPTGRIISQYDWDGYLEDLRNFMEFLESQNLPRQEYVERLNKWKNGYDEDKNVKRLIPIYIDPEYNEMYKNGNKDSIPHDAVYEMAPNPSLYNKNKNVINNLQDPQKVYYKRMMELKHEMMMKIPHRGQGLYKVAYISKDLVEGILDNSAGNPIKATLDNFKRRVTRRPDDIGFGADPTSLKDDTKAILESMTDSKKAADDILATFDAAIDDDIFHTTSARSIKRIIDRNKDSKGKLRDIDQTVSDIFDYINGENFYLVETNFTNQRIQKLPVYYTRRLKDMKMLSLDFSGTMLAYSSMAINYEKMNEVVDILEVARDYVKSRKVLENAKGNQPSRYRFEALGKVWKGFVNAAGNGSNIAGRIDDYMASVVYGEEKKDEGTWEIFNVDLDVAKSLDALKDYTGLLGLGLNVFSTGSNIAVGKIQQWIEAAGGEYFGFKDYAKACLQYEELIAGCVAEMNSQVKKNKLSLLIKMFDPMGDYYTSLRDPHYSGHWASKMLGNSTLAYIGMNAGEHLLRCQTMLAMLNATKLIDTKNNNKEISLYDALQPVTDPETGITTLELQEGLVFERELIDNTGGLKKDEKGRLYSDNKNYGKALRDENGKIITEQVELKDKEKRDFLFRTKRAIKKVNDSLNGAFDTIDKGAAHRTAIKRLVMQYRQWMPAHYMRRFARAHYDLDLQRWREGYYTTVFKVMNDMGKDLMHLKLSFLTTYKNLSAHEKANLRRAFTEIDIFFALMWLCKLGGRVKDRDRSWLDKMALYQIHRMYLEVGASSPINPFGFVDNILTILQTPSASIDTLEKFQKLLNLWNSFDEIQTGRYQGWTELGRNAYEMIPLVKQVDKAWHFDDSMFSMFDMDD